MKKYQKLGISIINKLYEYFFCCSTYESSIKCNCEESVFKMDTIREQFVNCGTFVYSFPFCPNNGIMEKV